MTRPLSFPAPAPDEVEPWLNPEEAAELLNVPVSWIYKRAKPGVKDPLPYIKVGSTLGFENRP